MSCEMPAGCLWGGPTSSPTKRPLGASLAGSLVPPLCHLEFPEVCGEGVGWSHHDL